MRIRVVQRADAGEDGYMIWFSTVFGEGRAEWAGPMPEIDTEYHVEMDLPSTLKWGKEILPAARSGFALRDLNGRLQLTAQIEAVEPDGCVVLRLGDAIILVDTIGVPVEASGFVDIFAERVMLYDEHV